MKLASMDIGGHWIGDACGVGHALLVSSSSSTAAQWRNECTMLTLPLHEDTAAFGLQLKQKRCGFAMRRKKLQ